MQLSDILVTGGHGFLGQHVLDELVRRGAGSVVMPGHAEFDLLCWPCALEVIANYGKHDIGTVLHLAAECGGIGANMAQPGLFFFANMQMGLNVIEASRQSGVKRIVVVGTTCAYPRDAPVPLREDSLWDGYPEGTNAPYGIAKRVLLTMLQAYKAQYGLEYRYLLPANLYGPGDNYDPNTSHVIPAMIRKFVEAKRTGDTVRIWGTGKPTREFLYVTDAARGVVDAAERDDWPEVANLGTGREISIADLAAIISDAVGYRGEIYGDASKPDGQLRRCLDTSRANACGWKAQVSLEEGIADCVKDFLDRFPG